VDEFAKSQVAMYLNGTWLPNEIKEQTPDLSWGSFAWPAIDSGGDGVEANNYGGQSFGVNKKSAYPNAAFAFIRWMTLGKYDQKLADDSMGVPMDVNASWPPQLEEAKTVFETSTKRLPWAVNMEDNAEVNAAIKDGFAKLVLGSYDAQQFADSLRAIKK
jgi:raffinose/stachyose/melibiose transport system substrate-binding protein